MKNFIAGLSIGTIVGMLFAPTRGQKTERRSRGGFGIQPKPPVKTAENLGRYAERVSHVAQDLVGGGNVQSEGKGGSAINTASRDELLKVQGVGPIMANRIIAGRLYRSERDALDRGVITREHLQRVAERIPEGRKGAVLQCRSRSSA